ncbi:uncharacterized protein [Argopecten irradians]|uniref:uncharacterized protein n=1 Tax=Argopecten irradians TaxID=31199 RepID=UPI0037226315
MASIHHLISMVIYLTCVRVVTTRKSPLATELDLLWDKYGEIRGQLAVLESQGISDRQKIEDIHQLLTAIQGYVEDAQREITQIADDLRSIMTTDKAQDDGADVNITSEGWKEFTFTLMRGAVRINMSYVVFSVDVDTTTQFSYIWFENGIPILDDDFFTRVQSVAGSVHTLELQSNQSSTIWNGSKVVSLQIQNHFNAMLLQFSEAEHSADHEYGHLLYYRVGTLHTQNGVSSGDVDLRSKLLLNRELRPSLGFLGVNGSDAPYDPVSVGSVFGSNGEPIGHGDILNITGNSTDGHIYTITYDLLTTAHANGGILCYTVTITKFDDVFNSVKYVIYDTDVFQQNDATLPKGSMAYLKDLFPREFKLSVGESNLLYCSAMGNPRPRLSILQLNTDGRETVTRYRSDVYNMEYISTVMLVIKPTKPEIANVSFVCAATSGSIERRLSLPTRIVVPPKFLRFEVLRGMDENVIVRLFVEHSGLPKPFVSCRENDEWGDFIWGKSPMYSANETSTRTGYIVTFSVNMAATTHPPTKFVCRVVNVDGMDRIIVPIHM